MGRSSRRRWWSRSPCEPVRWPWRSPLGSSSAASRESSHGRRRWRSWSWCSHRLGRCARSTSGPASRPTALGPYEGWVRLVDDPQPYPSSTRVHRRGRRRTVRAVVTRAGTATAGAFVAWGRVGHGERRARTGSMPNVRIGSHGSTSSANSGWPGRATSTPVAPSPVRRTVCGPRSNEPPTHCPSPTERCIGGW